MLSVANLMVVLAVCGSASSVQIDVSKTIKNATTQSPVADTTVPTIVVSVGTTEVITTHANTTEIPPTNVTDPITQLPNPVDVTNGTFPNANNSNQWPPVMRRKVTRRDHVSKDYFCKCDLTIHLCDINCCCDIDCSKEILKTFICDERDQTIHDYHWEFGLHSCALKNDLFCVFRHNPQRNEKFFDPLLRENRQNWPNAFAESPNMDDDREHYRLNDPILAYQELSEHVHPLTIPTAIVSTNCHINVPIEFLKIPKTSTCFRSADAHESFFRRLQSQLSTTKLLTSRRGIGNHAMMSEFCGLAADDSENSVCQPIHLFECVQSISPHNCHRFNETNYEIDADLQNQMIVFEFVHNFTNILNGSVYFIFTADNGCQLRTTEVRFRQLNDSLIPHHSVSGSIGYELGEPIIISFWTPFNSSDENSPTVVHYFHPNNSHHNAQQENQMKVPSFHQNECRLDNDTFETMSFGHDTYVKCDVVLNAAKNGETSNITELCRRFQSTIFEYILNGVRQHENQTHFSDIKTIVSNLGNPMNASEGWTHIASNVDPDAAVVDGQAVEGASGGGFRCRNMVLSVSYEFAFGRLRVNGHPYQNVVKEVNLRLGTKVDLRFQWGEVWRVPVFVNGIFADLTGAASRIERQSGILLICSFICSVKQIMGF